MRVRALGGVVALAAALLAAGNLWAAEEKSKRGPEGRPPRGPAVGQFTEMLKGINLNDEQKAKLDELKNYYGPKIKDLRQQHENILTEEQKKTRAEAVKAAREAGKKGEEIRKEAQAAMKITDEQKAQMEKTEKQTRSLRAEIREKVLAILTPEQKAELKKRHEHRKERKEKAGPQEKASS